MNMNSWAQSLSIPATAAQAPIFDMSDYQTTSNVSVEEGSSEIPWHLTDQEDFDRFMNEIQNNTKFLAQDRIHHRSMDGRFFVLF